MLTRKALTTFSSLIAALTVAASAYASDYRIGNIKIDDPETYATAAKQTSAAVYVELENKGSTDDKLVKAESTVAKSAKLHKMEMDNDVMKMREVSNIDLIAGTEIKMKQGRAGFHIMLEELTQPLKVNESFPLTLYFEKAGKTTVSVEVKAARHM